MIIDRKTKYNGYFSVDEISYKTKSGKESKKELMVRKDAVAALVYDSNKEKFIFVSQWRPGPSNDIVEIVAGTLDIPGEDKREAMKREIEEEIGYKTDTIKLIDECYMSPGGTSEIITIYYCEVSEKIGEGGGIGTEEIEILEMDLEETLSMRFKDAKTSIAIAWLRYNKRKFE